MYRPRQIALRMPCFNWANIAARFLVARVLEDASDIIVVHMSRNARLPLRVGRQRCLTSDSTPASARRSMPTSPRRLANEARRAGLARTTSRQPRKTMADVRRARARGQRRTSSRGLSANVADGLLAKTGEPGEQRLNTRQMQALDAMYQTHPAVQAARTVLLSQLLGGGLKLMRNGEVLQEVAFGSKDATGQRTPGITTDWAQHLETHWLPFAREVVDAFLKWGLCPVVLETSGDEDQEHVEAVEEMKRVVGVADGRKRKRAAAAPPTLVPRVPHAGTYDLAWLPTNGGYGRRYVLYPATAERTMQIDHAARVFVRQHPDVEGNLNSPIATVYDTGSFVSGLVELAFVSEIARSQPTMTTQLRKQDKSTELATGSLFFDSESRELAASQEESASSAAARALEMQTRLCEIINKLQTRDGGASSNSTVGGRLPIQPPDIAPKLFVLPKDHELAPNVQLPQPRGDLESLMRLGVDQFCTALGVPAALVFEGRFASNAATQLSLLNSTVTQLAKATNDVLTAVYRVVYDDGDANPVQLKLHTSPLASAAEVSALFSSQLIDRKSALPMVLHSLGLHTDEIDAAMQRAEENEVAVKEVKEATDAAAIATAKATAADPTNSAKGAGSGAEKE